MEFADFKSFNKTSKTYFGTDKLSIQSVLNWYNRQNFKNNFRIAEFVDFFQHIFIGFKSDYLEDLRKGFDYFDEDKDGALNDPEFRSMLELVLRPAVEPRSALVIVDVQNDFISGSLSLRKYAAKEDGAEVVPVINRLLTQHQSGAARFQLVVYTYDWHPRDHISFFDNIHGHRLSQHSPVSLKNVKLLDKVLIQLDDDGQETVAQVLWPTHCVQNTEGAALHNDLLVVDNACHVRKGVTSNVDSYSAFGLNHPRARTILHDCLRECDSQILFICGLATDVCVAQTSLDALSLGYRVVVLSDACRGVDKVNIDCALAGLVERGAVVTECSKVAAFIEGDIRPAALAVFALNSLHR